MKYISSEIAFAINKTMIETCNIQFSEVVLELKKHSYRKIIKS